MNQKKKRPLLSERKRGNRLSPEGYPDNDIEKGDMFLFMFSRFNSMSSGRLPEPDFMPECPNPEPLFYPLDVWVLVDSMTCKRSFEEDLNTFRDFTEERSSAFNELIGQATNEVLDELKMCLKREEQFKLIKTTKRCVLPTIINRLVYRRVIFWSALQDPATKSVATMMGYEKGSRNYGGFRELLRKLGLTTTDLSNLKESSKLLDEEREWLDQFLS